MVAPGFGFSIGDFVAGGKILVEVVRAFKEAGGASSKYTSEISFLKSLQSTFDHLERFISNSSTSQDDDSLLEDVSKLLEQVREPWEEFKNFLDKYESSLGLNSRRSKLAKAPRTIQYTVKDISGTVWKLRRQTEQPLQAINSLLSLHVIQSLEKAPGQILRPAQCAQLVEAITLADIPRELDKQIRVLQLAADEHNVKQDEQLQVITTLRSQLEERISSLQTALDNMNGPDLTASDRHQEQLNTSRNVRNRVDQLSEVLEGRADKLESAMKEQKQLMLALKAFLEDRNSKSELALGSDNQNLNNSGIQSSWPSSTLSTAYFAALLLSSLLSSVAVTSIVAKHRAYKGTARPVFLPMDYSLPGLGSLNKTIQIEPALTVPVDDVARSPSQRGIAVASTRDEPGTTIREIVTSTQAKPEDLSTSKVSSWLRDFSRTQGAVRQAGERPSRVERRESVASDASRIDWSKQFSKLNNPTNNDKPDRDHHDDHHDDHGDAPDGDDGSGSECDDGDGPGPVIPDDDGGFDWGGGGGGGEGGAGGGSNDGNNDSSGSGGGFEGGGGGGNDSDSS